MEVKEKMNYRADSDTPLLLELYLQCKFWGVLFVCFKAFCLSDTIVLCAGNCHLALISSFCQFVTTLLLK